MPKINRQESSLLDRRDTESSAHPVPSAAHHTTEGLGNSTPTLVLITENSEIAGLRDDWHRLLPKDSAPFSTFEWVSAWYHSFEGKCDEILIFVAVRDGRSIAILPCYRDGRKIRLAGDITCDYQDLVAESQEDSLAAMNLIFDWLNTERPGSEFFFEKVSSRGFLMSALEEFSPDDSGVLLFRKNYMPCPCVTLPGSLEEYLLSIPRKPRSEFRRVVNRLEREMPDAAIEIWKGKDVVRGHLTKAANFHVKHFRKGGDSPLADPRLIAMLHHIAGSEEVGLRVSVLRNGDSLMAVDFGFCRGGSFYGYLTDFDETYSHLSPGRCLFVKRIDHWIHEENITTLDLLGGGEKYKKGYTGGEFYQVSTIRILPRNPLGRVRFTIIQLNRACRQLAKKIISITSRIRKPKRG